MPWNWTPVVTETPTLGRKDGVVADAATPSAWPQYKAEYLKQALQSEDRKYDTSGMDDVQREVYLQKVTANAEGEAEAALRQEFDLWLQGKHIANSGNSLYVNYDPNNPNTHDRKGAPVRRWTYRTDAGEVGEARNDWKHTPWGAAQLTHLPGVRDYLRDRFKRGYTQDVALQLLAEHGPQDLDQAWMYFKHWVKGRPLQEGVDMGAGGRHVVEQSGMGRVGPMMPTAMHELQQKSDAMVRVDDDQRVWVDNRAELHTSVADRFGNLRSAVPTLMDEMATQKQIEELRQIAAVEHEMESLQVADGSKAGQATDLDPEAAADKLEQMLESQHRFGATANVLNQDV